VADHTPQLLGAHVSISGGIFKAIENGENIGANAIQIFSKNQTRWMSKPLTDEDADKFKRAWYHSSIKEVVIHDSYLINLGSPDPTGLNKSRAAFLDEIERAEKLGIGYLVFHPGSHLNSSLETGLKTVAESLNRMIVATPNYSVRLLLEATAGQGTNLGYTFEQLAAIIDMVEAKQRMGVCLDTAHIFAAGYDIRTPENYEMTIATFDSVLGLQNLFCIHLIHNNICQILLLALCTFVQILCIPMYSLFSRALLFVCLLAPIFEAKFGPLVLLMGFVLLLGCILHRTHQQICLVFCLVCGFFHIFCMRTLILRYGFHGH